MLGSILLIQCSLWPLLSIDDNCSDSTIDLVQEGGLWLYLLILTRESNFLIKYLGVIWNSKFQGDFLSYFPLDLRLITCLYFSMCVIHVTGINKEKFRDLHSEVVLWSLHYHNSFYYLRYTIIKKEARDESCRSQEFITKKIHVDISTCICTEGPIRPRWL